MQEYDCDWKRRLRQEIITALTGGSAEQIEAFAQVGYYYISAKLQHQFINISAMTNEMLRRLNQTNCGTLHHVNSMMCSTAIF